MVTLSHPLALLALPLLAALFWWRRHRPRPSLGLPDGRAIAAAGSGPGWRWLPAACRIGGLVLLALALSGPRWGHETIRYHGRGVDLMLCIDLSESMAAMDFRLGNRSVSRLEAVADVAERFVASRPGDRIGLVAFGSRAYTVLPPTDDHAALIRALHALTVGAAGKRTALGDALVLAVKHLYGAPGRSKAAVMLSDGTSNAGETSPTEAAALAAGHGITVYAVGVGGDAPAPFLVDHPLLGPEIVYEKAAIDETGLRELAKTTGGFFWRASEMAGLARTINRIGDMEPTDMTARRIGERFSLTPPLIALAALLLTAFAVLAGSRFTELP